MRYHEIASGVRLHVNTEENALLNRAEAESLKLDDLEERELEVIRNMVSRGLLDLHKVEGGFVVHANSVKDIWRGLYDS